MKKTLFTLFVLLPVLSSAQISNDGKSDSPSSSSAKKSSNSSRNFSILYSASTNAPFGAKIQYCKSFGGYIAFKSDFGLGGEEYESTNNWSYQDHYYLTGGLAIGLGSKANLYLGTGLDLGYYENNDYWTEQPGLVFEAGTILKGKRIAFDLGLGYSSFKLIWESNHKEEGIASFFFVNLGIGFKL